MPEWLGHMCGPYCHDDTHATVVWSVCDPPSAAPDVLRMACKRLGVTFLHAEEAKEAGPVPAGEVGPWLEGDTGERGVMPCPPDAIPYLLVWR